MAMAKGVMGWLCSFLAVLTAAMVTASDEAALLAFKAQLSNGGSLASWNSSTSFCSWEGVMCIQRRPARVVALILNGTGLAGSLSLAIGNLTFLRELDLSFNSLHGDIPASLGRLRRLQNLILNDNSFSGTLPANLSSCVSMIIIVLDNNMLGGRIPAELGDKLTSLAVISLTNIFTGPIPASLANLSRLEALELGTNQLTGSIPSGFGSTFGSTQSTRIFVLLGNNLSGMLPPSLFNWSSMEQFDVQFNMLHGSIPDDIGTKFTKMKVLGLGDNHFTGVLPSSLSNMSDLRHLSLAQNRFSGYVPPTLGKLGALQGLYFAYNELEANDKEGWEFITSLADCSQLQRLEIAKNSFGGQIPGSVVNLSTTLQYLGLSDNMIFGVIPSSLGNLSQLVIITAYYGNLEGPIPASLSH